MNALTRELWDQQNRHPGDRHRLFRAVGAFFDATTVLYPGSFVDVAPSFVFADVTYVDSDARAARFFGDSSGVEEIIAANAEPDHTVQWRFIHSDYMADLDIDDGTIDLLISLYAGFVSEACSRYLRPGGLLLVNPSHGDAAMASLDPGFSLAAVVLSRSGRYSVGANSLDEYLLPKRSEPVTRDILYETRRGVAYTKQAFAYVFQWDPPLP